MKSVAFERLVTALVSVISKQIDCVGDREARKLIAHEVEEVVLADRRPRKVDRHGSDVFPVRFGVLRENREGGRDHPPIDRRHQVVALGRGDEFAIGWINSFDLVSQPQQQLGVRARGSVAARSRTRAARNRQKRFSASAR